MYGCEEWKGEESALMTSWVQGYWSGLTLHPGYEKVGVTLGPIGIIAVVKLECINHPEENIANATVKAFAADKIRRDTDQ